MAEVEEQQQQNSSVDQGGANEIITEGGTDEIITEGASVVRGELPQDDAGPPKVDSQAEVLHEKVTKQIIKEGHGQKPSKYATCFLHYRAWAESTQHKFEDTWREQQPLELVSGVSKCLVAEFPHIQDLSDHEACAAAENRSYLPLSKCTNVSSPLGSCKHQEIICKAEMKVLPGVSFYQFMAQDDIIRDEFAWNEADGL
ncbi:hypothetical protein FXO37_27845 [Capsicum annuum]|nr:hypothetical protein FXO37_27845 [Capsicum annuum]